MSVELLDELEAGELAVEFEGEEPEVVLEWAIERFSPSLSISTAFQTDGAVLLDMAYAIDPTIRMFSVDTGRLPGETFELIEQMRDRYPGLQLDLLSPEGAAGQRDGRQARAEPLLQERREPAALLPGAQGAAAAAHLAGLDAWITGLRRDQWATRSDIRKVEIDHDHGAIVKLNPLAEWSEDEVWDYVREHDLPYNSLYDQGYTSIGCAPCTRPTQGGRGPARRPLVVGDERAEGVRHPLRDRDRRPRARAARADRRRRMSDAIASARARRARSRSPRRRPCCRWRSDDAMRARLAELVAAVDDGEVGGEAAELLESVLELGLQTGRIRAYYGPGGEQAALSTLQEAAAGPRCAPRARATSRRRCRRSPARASTRSRSPPSRPAPSASRSRPTGWRRRCASTRPARG